MRSIKCPVKGCLSDCVDEWVAPFCKEHLKLLNEEIRSEMNKTILDIAAAEAYHETDPLKPRLRLVALRANALRQVEEGTRTLTIRMLIVQAMKTPLFWITLALLIIGLLMPFTAFAQLQVSLVPESLAASQAIFGKGRDVGRWSVLMCSDYTVQRSIDRVRLLRAFPDIHVLTSRETEDQLTRKAAKDSRSVIGNVGDAVLAVAGGGTALGGLAAGSKTAQYVGWGITGLQVALKLFRAAHAPPNAQPYLVDMLPDQISLDAGKCLEPEKWVLASLVKGAHTEQATIFLPGDPIATLHETYYQPHLGLAPDGRITVATTSTHPAINELPYQTVGDGNSTISQRSILKWFSGTSVLIDPWANELPFSALPIVNMSSILWGF